MANRAAPALGLREGDRVELVRLTRSSSVRAGLAQRARIVLLAGEGSSNTAIADKVGVARATVIAWRGRYERSGIAGLYDEKRSGRPRHVDHRAIVAATLKPPPKKLGVTHWSSRLLAERLGIGNATVARARLGALRSAYGWALWGFIQAASSPLDFDFHAWGLHRYEKAARTFRDPSFSRLLDEAADD